MVRRGQAARDCHPPSPAFPDRCATWVHCALLFYSPPLVVCFYQVTSPSPPPARRRVWVGFWSPGPAFHFFSFSLNEGQAGFPRFDRRELLATAPPLLFSSSRSPPQKRTRQRADKRAERLSLVDGGLGMCTTGNYRGRWRLPSALASLSPEVPLGPSLGPFS